MAMLAGRIGAAALRGVRALVARVAPSAGPSMRAVAQAWLCAVLCLIGAALPCAPAAAGSLTREALEQAFPDPLSIGDRDPAIPVWPIFRRDATQPAPVLAGYVFESVDFTPEPGFSGKPINLLIALDPQGRFLSVKVLSHSEPIFRHGLGESALPRFAAQYDGASVKDTIRILSDPADATRAQPGVWPVMGIARGTLTVRTIDKSIVASALTVAKAKLGIQVARSFEEAASLRTDRFSAADWRALARDGLIATTRLTNAQIEAGFAGTPAAGADPAMAASPDATAIELQVAMLSIPQVGRNLLGEDGWALVNKRLAKGEFLLLAASSGPQTLVGDRWVPAGVPERLSLRQGDRLVEIRDLIYDGPIALPPGVERRDAKLLRVVGHAGLDPGQPLNFSYALSRVHGAVIKQRYTSDVRFDVTLPEDWLLRPAPQAHGWRALWKDRAAEIGVLVAGLALLSVALVGQRRLAASPRVARAFRLGYLAFTLGFIGWYAQGQLSIVNLTALLEALRVGRSLDFFLYDPMTVILWVFVAVTLVAWGRGTFCGWLCPFGALQELVSTVTRRLGLKPRRLHTRVDARLKWIKYGVLAAILVVVAVAPDFTEAAIEVEPFKTAISLNFVREWPYVVWAVATIALSVFVYRGYCRYLCPLGALLAIGGKVRVWGWLARRVECGKPCQTCRHRCDYQAIAPDGRIGYAECFQCLDCVVIHQSDTQCAPRIVEAKRRRTIPVVPVAVTTEGGRA